ncbi:Retrovirus-related Pol polyprotein, partial [Ophiophagus hannah]
MAVGAVLLQKNMDGILQPCAYTSRKFSSSERNWAIREKEAFAVHWALVWTDHKNLEALQNPCQLSPKQVRWALFF